ncbi:MAG: cobalamin-binding protein, partial [Candidatus Cloacimonadota bacterium]
MSEKVVVLFFILLLLIGCQQQDRSFDQDRYIVTSPEVAEILAALGAIENIVGITQECNYPIELNNIEKVGNFGKVDFEKIIDLNPNIVFTSGLEQDALSSELAKLNIRVEKIYPNSIAELLNSILRIGVLVDRKEQAETLADSLRNELAKMEEYKFSQIPRIYIEIYGDPLMSVNKISFVGELITLAGGDNIFSSLPREYSRIDAEKVIEADPEVIILTYPGVSA